MSIGALVDRLRTESCDFPLGVVVYGWGSADAEDFVNTLGSSLRAEDAVVLLPSKRARASSLPALAGSVVLLDMNRPSHQRMYENRHLTGDIVFFSEPDEVEASEVRRWKGVARAVIVREGAPGADAVLRAARAAPIYAWQWKGEGGISA